MHCLKAPESLYLLQKWFSEVITRPLNQQYYSKKEIAPGRLLVDEAPLHVIPSPTMLPHERMEVYNQQYWWRLLEILQLDYPFVVRLFGKGDFCACLAEPYLDAFPPRHWSLKLLSEGFFDWLEKNYQAEDRDLVLHAAKLDLMVTQAFCAEGTPAWEPKEEEIEALLEAKGVLQPFVAVTKTEGHLMKLREQFLEQEPAYWEENDFPSFKREGVYPLVVYRDCAYDVSWKVISEGEYLLLSSLKQGKSLKESCCDLEDQEISEEIGAGIQDWIQLWVEAGWLSVVN